MAASQEGASTKRLPSNREYGNKAYWDERFSTEDQYEWLLGYEQVASHLVPWLRSDDRILIVGCGNSDFSAGLYDAGFENVTNIDYSEVVISNMKEKNQHRTAMDWRVLDMTDMSTLGDQAYDVVIDKAAMDALMTQEGDVWNPNEDVVSKSRSMCGHISRILVDRGIFLQISFQQAHFRKKYLLGWHGAPTSSNLKEDRSDEFNWSFKVDTIGGDRGCFENFLYIMQKGGQS